MIDAALGICLGLTFVAGTYGVWTWQNFSRKMVEYNELQDDYDALYQIWLKTARENADLRSRTRQ
jgi:hypothetical protein